MMEILLKQREYFERLLEDYKVEAYEKKLFE